MGIYDQHFGRGFNLRHTWRIRENWKKWQINTAVVFAATVLLLAPPVNAQVTDTLQIELPHLPDEPEGLVAARAVIHTVRPAKREFSEELLEELDVPDGFEVTVFARDLGNVRMITVADDGTVFITRRDEGIVTSLRDTSGDGVADQILDVASGLEDVHGLAIRESSLYMVSNTELYAADILENGGLGQVEVLQDDLPDAGQHPNRTIRFGPDDMLYLSIGSTCNACVEPNPEHATILRATPQGGDRAIFAQGLRNTIGFDWHPETGELWGMDHNTDERGDDVPPEQLNRIEEGKHYGWPFCWGDREIDPVIPMPPPDGRTRQEFCADTEPMVLGYTAHAAPMGMEFYRGTQFPQEYHGDAFVAMRGSWNRMPPAGYEIVRIQYDNGEPVSIEPFISGWLIEGGEAQFGRLVGVAVAQDGALLVTDDSNGVVYRIAYAESERAER